MSEDRELRNLLEQAQGELSRAREELLASKTAAVALQEENEFLKWSLNGGESKDVVRALAESRAECEALKQRVAELNETLRLRPVAPQATPVRVCIISVVAHGTARDAVEYVAFRVGSDKRSVDLIRTSDLVEARMVAREAARELGVEIEDLA